MSSSLTYDYNGLLVAPSKPVKQLRKVKKTINIDSKDRDTTKYPYNGDFVVYLPRVYKNVTSIRLKSASFPKLINTQAAEDTVHAYVRRISPASTTEIGIGGSTADNPTVYYTCPNYFFLDIEGLNKSDECSPAGDRSARPDGYMAKIPAVITGSLSSNPTTSVIGYSDSNAEDNIAVYTPPIENLDRLHIRVRLHEKDSHFIFWDYSRPTNGQYYVDSSPNVNFDLSIEIEYLENGFDEFSSFETRLSERS